MGYKVYIVETEWTLQVEANITDRTNLFHTKRGDHIIHKQTNLHFD